MPLLFGNTTTINNVCQVWFINYKQEFQQTFDYEIESYYYDIYTAIFQIFLNDSYNYIVYYKSILISEEYMMVYDEFFYLTPMLETLLACQIP